SFLFSWPVPKGLVNAWDGHFLKPLQQERGLQKCVKSVSDISNSARVYCYMQYVNCKKNCCERITVLL
ncbi:hypothetical protein S1OALGB6SA_214, partial [Olavius algarvensis spirochete endosymbiont]